jgi:hypothetical protein
MMMPVFVEVAKEISLWSFVPPLWFLWLGFHF